VGFVVNKIKPGQDFLQVLAVSCAYYHSTNAPSGAGNKACQKPSPKRLDSMHQNWINNELPIVLSLHIDYVITN
jgi:hypothetical protein